MKDYYNILGVKKNATYYHITEAYRELSVKFHPDNHDNNQEYIEKYNDVQEAYATLSNGIKRRDYDNYINHLEKNVEEKRTNTQVHTNPTIEFFKTDKAEFEYGEEITFSWKTLNADKVTLVPFGPVQPFGSYSNKIKNYKNKLLTYELLAENTLNGKEAKAAVTIKNRNFEEFYTHFKKEVESQITPIQPKFTESKSTEPKSAEPKFTEPKSAEPQDTKSQEFQFKKAEPVRAKPVKPDTNKPEPVKQDHKGIEKDHLPYLPGHKEEEKQKITRPVPPKEIPKNIVPEKIIKKEKKSSGDSENNILLFIVILFLVFGISVLIYLGFFL